MADPIVGQSLEKPTKPTKVPKSAPAPTEAIDQALAQPTAQINDAPVASPASIPQPVSLPSGFSDLGEAQMLEQGQFADADDSLQILPSYADGSSVQAPINKSPVDLADRLKMAAGNKVGNLQYLKHRYGDAKLDKYGNYVVLKDGSWYRVDPTGLGDGDAWDRTRELIADTADLADIALSTAGSIGGAMAGTALATPGAGSVAGATLGGAAAEGIRSSLGRLVGTYQATPEEQLKDIGWEGLLAMGGQSVALGAKPVLGMMKNAMENIATSATNVSKEMSSGVWSQLTGQPRWALRRAMDSPADVLDKSQEALKLIPRGASPVDALDVIQGKQNSILEGMANTADSALKGQYKKDLTTLIDKTPQNFTADVKTMVNDAKLNLADAGYGKIVGNPGNEKFVPLSNAEIAAQLGVPEAQLPKILGPETKEALGKVSNILNDYDKFGSLSGKMGAAKTVELKRALGESFSELLGDNVPASVKQIVTKTKASLDQSIGEAFAKHGVGEDFIKMNNNYASQKDAVDMLTNAVKSKNPSDVENLIKRLVSKSGSFKALKDEAKSLANLLPEGQRHMENLVDWEAAKAFVDFVPKTFGGNSATTIGKIVGAVTQQSNPRAIGQQIKYANKTVDFLKSMGPKQVNALLGNDQAMQALFTIPLQAAQREDQEAETLLQQAGVK